MKIISVVKQMGKILAQRTECDSRDKNNKLGGVFYPDTTFNLDLDGKTYQVSARLEKVEYFPKKTTVIVSYVLTKKKLLED